MSDATPNLSRRSFVKTTGALGALAAAGGTLAASEQLFGNVTPAMADEAAPEEKIAWSQCNVNCGGNCVFQWHSVGGKVQYMETDNTGDDPNFQARACLRGRSMRKWLNHPDRLLYPMKRVGARGEGKFEQISWDEATDIIAEKLKWVYSEYGPEAIHINYATGMYASMGKPGNRLLALLGGYLNQGADYSTHMLQVVMPYMFGWDGEKGNVFSPYDNVNASSFTEAEAHSDLVVMFGNSPAETRMGGINAVWDFNNVREAVEGGPSGNPWGESDYTLSADEDRVIFDSRAGLRSGQLFYIQEIAAPKDFLIDSTKYYFFITSRPNAKPDEVVEPITEVDGRPVMVLDNWSLRINPALGNIYQYYLSYDFDVLFENYKFYILPETGGPGELPVLLLGGFLLVLPCAVLLRRRRRARGSST